MQETECNVFLTCGDMIQIVVTHTRYDQNDISLKSMENSSIFWWQCNSQLVFLLFIQIPNKNAFGRKPTTRFR